MENNSAKNLIVSLLCSVSEYEKDIIIQRNKLHQAFCFKSNFGYFKYLDKNKKNYIDYTDLVTFLSLWKIKCTPAKLKQIIKIYDKDCDHCWNFDEYSKFIQPSMNNTFFSPKLEENASSVQTYEQELVTLFKKEIEFLDYSAIKITNIKSVLGGNYSPLQIFDDIKGNSATINQNNLFFFLNQDSSQTASYEDIKLILNRIGNGNEITLKQLEMHLSYHKFIKDKDTNYVKSYGYYKTNPIDHTKVLYYDVYNEYEQSKTSFSFKQKNNEY